MSESTINPSNQINKKFYLTKGKPFLALDKYFENHGMMDLIAMDDLICQGIAKATWFEGTYGPTLLNPYPLTMYNAEEKYKCPERLKDDRYAFRRYLKIRYPVYGPNHSIYLKMNTSYATRENEANWINNANYFPELKDWIETHMPFDYIGRVLIFINQTNSHIPIHKDSLHWDEREATNFIWFRPNLYKNFFIYDAEQNIKHYVNNYFIHFHDLNWHGGDPTDRMTYSIRVDGKFTQTFKDNYL